MNLTPAAEAQHQKLKQKLANAMAKSIVEKKTVNVEARSWQAAKVAINALAGGAEGRKWHAVESFPTEVYRTFYCWTYSDEGNTTWDILVCTPRHRPII